VTSFCSDGLGARATAGRVRIRSSHGRQANAVAHLDPLVGLGALAVDPHLTLAQQAVHVRARHALERAHQEIVEALSRVALASLDVLHAAGPSGGQILGGRRFILVSH
jgi:hypothetical protein